VWGAATAPLPTNRWWVNLALPDGELIGENVVAPLPYLIKALPDGLHVCLPVKDVTATYVALPFDDTLAFGATEMAHSSGATHEIEAHDGLSVTVAWSAGGSGRMSTPLVRGMPYATAIYEHLTPLITFATSPITSLNGAAPPTGTQCVLTRQPHRHMPRVAPCPHAICMRFGPGSRCAPLNAPLSSART